MIVLAGLHARAEPAPMACAPMWETAPANLCGNGVWARESNANTAPGPAKNTPSYKAA